MAFCRKCGAAMAEDDLVCVKCGTKVANVKDDLIEKLEKYKELLGENEELTTMIRPQSEFPSSDQVVYKKRSFMKFFWPFLVGGVVGGYAVYMLSTLVIVATSTSAYSQATAASAMGDALLGFFLALIVAGAIIFIGVRISKNKQDAHNSVAEAMIREASERYQKGLMNEKMVNLYQENVNTMRQYERFVPEKYRTSSLVGSINDVLKEDKAETVEEAIMLIG